MNQRKHRAVRQRSYKQVRSRLLLHSNTQLHRLTADDILVTVDLDPPWGAIAAEAPNSQWGTSTYFGTLGFETGVRQYLVI